MYGGVQPLHTPAPRSLGPHGGAPVVAFAAGIMSRDNAALLCGSEY